MELRQLHTFREVTKSMSFTRAANTLNYAQSSVSAQIQALEEELGVNLFDRLGRKVVLTEAGERLLGYADRMLALAHQAQIVVPSDEEPRGTLTIGAPETLLAYRLPAVLAKFRQLYPQVELVFHPADTRENWDHLLSEGSTDAAVFLSEPFQSPHLIVEPLIHEPIYLVVCTDHALAQRSQISAEDLRGETVLLTEAGCSYRTVFERSLQKASICPATVLEFHSVEAIKQCAMGGMGIAVLIEVAVAKEIAQGRLAVLPWRDPGFEMITHLAWHKDKWISPALRAFLGVTRELLSGAI